jgi:hypothetical protein
MRWLAALGILALAVIIIVVMAVREVLGLGNEH